ncbi:DNA polymerase III subunit alpha [Geomonas sp. RF6]|uniref:DNA polymerase III subunit alpha n=1 Tax=Geomonas sp. RF6 TaxID=2897342 RepID=UPI001E39B427|nr:DNA polymerase III subunit alpha [Geomonas sp. RF6]UFS70756.1 DNA polymerase III subunit alpha [Geomonas sp. RF6]
MFIPLHVKSDYSLGFGTASVEELIERAVALGYRALALTDLENLYAQVRFHQGCREAGIRPLTGLELRPGFDGRHNVGRKQGRVVLLALDESGYRSLCRIVSRRRSATLQRPMEAPHRDPLPVAMKCSDGLMALSDDPAVVEELFYSGSFLPEQLGVLLVRPDEQQRDRRRIEAAERLGVRLVADLDCTFLRQGDHPLHVLQLAIRQGRPMRDTALGADVEGRERWLRSPAEVALLFADQPQALHESAEIANLASFDLQGVQGTSPISPFIGTGSAAATLKRICLDALEDLMVERHRRRDYLVRLEHELQVFEALGFSGFMAVVADILSHCRRLGIPVAVRGSAVSSLTLHLLGGSPVDPLRHGLLFERFLHKGKSAWPDVDIDLPWHRRDEVIDWVYRRYGQDKVAMVAAHHTFRYRSALREGLKAWGASPTEIERASALLPPEDLASEELDFLGMAEAAQEEIPEEIDGGGGAPFPRMGEIFPLIRRLVGRPHHIAAHPGGIVVDRYPLEDLLPLERAPKGVIITQYDLVAVSRLGLAKIDLLGNRCLSELEEALAPRTLSDIPPEDPETLALIDDARTVGCFQLESPAMRSLLKRLPIRSQNDVTAALALIRPGAASGEVKGAFVRRARDEEGVNFPFRLMEDRLRETYGLFLYEEDVMLLLSRTGGITLDEADELRRAIVKSGGDPATLALLQSAFLDRASAVAGRKGAQARRAWATATRLAAYSFNKAHAASYALLAYYSAYAKVHCPLEFACALINHHQGLYPLRVEVAELSRIGIVVQAPHVNESQYHSFSVTAAGQKGSVRVGLDKVKGLSVRRAMEILEDRRRRGPYASLRNLLERVPLSLREVAALVLSGACDELSPLHSQHYPFAHEAALEQLQEGSPLPDLDRLRVALPDTESAEGERIRLYQALVRVRNELSYLQMHLAAHPMALLREEAQRMSCVTVEEASHASAGKTVRLAVVVAAMRRVQTRQGAMQFLTVEDETGLLEAALLPVVFQELGDRIKTAGPFLVEGRIRRQQEAVHLEVSYLTPFHKRPGPFGALD